MFTPGDIVKHKLMTSEVFNVDCLEYMKTLPDKFFDLCLSDLPYGVNAEYNIFDDSPQNTIDLINKSVPEIIRVSKLVVLTCGVKLMYEYPKPDWVGCIYSSAGIGVGSHGFCCWQPILIYGKDPKLQILKGSHPDSIVWNSGNDIESKFHPVPKPLKLWRKIMNRWSNDGFKIFDPFLGSATGRIAAHDLGFDFWGCELDEDYFKAGCKRFENHKAQLTLF